MTVSLCVIAYNEHDSLPPLLEDILHQTYPKKDTELVFVDSGSTDDTKQIFTDFASARKNDYLGIVVCDNPEKNQASGWNTAIKAASGDIIIRVDAHASVPELFIENNVRVIASGEDVCGGARPSNILEPTPWREMLLLAESSMFGSSFASYRRTGGGKKYVSSLFHGAYRREVFAKAGGFNKDLGRTEDNELHWRIRQYGYRICQSDDIISYQNIRPTLGAMLRQKYGNGKWIGLTVGVCPGCLSLFHFVPFCFVLAIIVCAALLAVGIVTGITLLTLPAAALCAAYILADLFMSVTAMISAKKFTAPMLLLGFIFPMLHIYYGAGTLIGLCMMPHWKHSLDGSAEKEIEEVRKCAAAKLH